MHADVSYSKAVSVFPSVRSPPWTWQEKFDHIHRHISYSTMSSNSDWGVRSKMRKVLLLIVKARTATCTEQPLPSRLISELLPTICFDSTKHHSVHLLAPVTKAVACNHSLPSKKMAVLYSPMWQEPSEMTRSSIISYFQFNFHLAHCLFPKLEMIASDSGMEKVMAWCRITLTPRLLLYPEFVTKLVRETDTNVVTDGRSNHRRQCGKQYLRTT